MKGNNEIKLNQATMIDAMQQWLDSVMPENTSKVSAVKLSDDRLSNSFVIFLTDKDTP